jgi:molybdopterin-binding protein
MLKGTIKEIHDGAINAEIVVEVAPDVEMTSIITKTSVAHLGLAVGKEAFVIVKASNVMLGTE